MREIHCYVSKGKFDDACRKEWFQRDSWDEVMKELSGFMDENIKSIYTLPYQVGFPNKEIESFKEENKKLFRKDGMLKKTGKGAQALRNFYKAIIKKYQLENYSSLTDLRFSYGLYRLHGQTGEWYRDFDGRSYQKYDFVPSGAAESLTEISQIEYEENYIRLLKEQEKRKQKA